MAIKAFVALSIALANPAWAGEEIGTGDSGTWSFAQDQVPPDVGSEQPVALARFVYPASAVEAADAGGEHAVLTSSSLTEHGLPPDGTAIAQAVR